MTSELINTSINNKVEALTDFLLNANLITDMCKAVSFDERRGVALLTAYPNHPLWNRGEYENVEDWPLKKQITYLIVHGFTPEKLFHYAHIDMTQDPNQDLFLQDYNVVVRAIASMKEPIPPIIEWSEPWNVYGHDSSQGNVTVRLDTVISVKAKNKENAIERAMCLAPLVNTDVNVEMDVTIWVDKDLEDDVCAINP
jgi:hypothetical protein